MSRFMTLTTEVRQSVYRLAVGELSQRTGLEVGSVTSLFVLLFEEREPIELDHLVRHASTTEEIADRLGE